MISTGTLTGMLAPRPGETYVAAFGAFGTATLSFT
jgi:2-keto-4-pentenoate hydratase